LIKKKINTLAKGIALVSSFVFGQVDHIVFTEVVITPSDGEYVEITNPTPSAIDLSNYYLTDGTDVSSAKFYYNLPSGSNYWSGSSSDFICSFPDNYSIPAGASIKISLRDSDSYQNTYGVLADLSLEDDMLDAVESVSTIGSASRKLDNSSESLVLFYWDGSSEVVKDIDYLLWGDNSFAIDKSDISGYEPDTPVGSQSFMPFHVTEQKLMRLTNSDEGSENQAGGNGITGHDETSEPLSETWTVVSLTSSKPDISELSLTPSSPTIESMLTFSATVTDDEGLASVILKYEFQNEEVSLPMANADGLSIYSVQVEPLGESGSLIYSVIAEDNTGLKDSTSKVAVMISEPPEELTIASLLEDLDSYIGQVVEIDGVVTVPAGRLRTNFTEAFLQDESGKGIILYNSQLDTSFTRGDSVKVVAEVDDFDGKPELIYSSITVLEENVTIPVEEITIAQFNSLQYGYTFVKLWGKIISRSDPFGTNTGANISLQDASGEVTTVRIWNSTNILYDDGNNLINPDLDSLLQVGSLIEIAGIGGEYSGASQLQPAYKSDINEKLEGQVGDYIASLSVSPYPFVPQLGEVIDYSYSFPSDARIKLRVFDTSGRLITTLYDEYRGISFYNEASWNGRDNLNRLVPGGTYLIHLDIIDAITGKNYQKVAPVVIAVYKN